MRIYLDNAATTPLDKDVYEAMTAVMKEDFGNPSSIHALGRKAKTHVEKARKTVAEILNASSGEIFFTSSATESNNMAIKCSVRDLGVQRIISSPTEHPCVLNTLKDVNLHHPDVEIRMLDVDNKGNVDYTQLETWLQDKSKKTLVSLMHGNNEIGTILDLDRVSALCVAHNALLHCDAVQTIGKREIDLAKTKVSFLSASGHKIYGPKGIGMIYINSDNMIPPMICGGGQERGIRSGTENVYGIVGFSTALEKLVQNNAAYCATHEKLRTHLKTELKKRLPNIDFNGNQEEMYLPHILSLRIPQSDKTDMIMFNLDIVGVCASAGSACSSGAERGSHVIEALGLGDDYKSLRLSLSHHNTIEEMNAVAEHIESFLA